MCVHNSGEIRMLQNAPPGDAGLHQCLPKIRLTREQTWTRHPYRRATSCPLCPNAPKVPIRTGTLDASGHTRRRRRAASYFRAESAHSNRHTRRQRAHSTPLDGGCWGEPRQPAAPPPRSRQHCARLPRTREQKWARRPNRCGPAMSRPWAASSALRAPTRTGTLDASGHTRRRRRATSCRLCPNAPKAPIRTGTLDASGHTRRRWTADAAASPSSAPGARRCVHGRGLTTATHFACAVWRMPCSSVGG